MEPTPATRTAVEFLMLWMEPDRAAAAAHIADVVHDTSSPETAETALAGQLNLGMILLFRLAKAQGATTAEELYAKARELLQELSGGLPE